MRKQPKGNVSRKKIFMELLPLVQLVKVSNEFCCRQASGSQVGTCDLTDYEEREVSASRTFHIFLVLECSTKAKFHSKQQGRCYVQNEGNKSNAMLTILYFI